MIRTIRDLCDDPLGWRTQFAIPLRSGHKARDGSGGNPEPFVHLIGLEGRNAGTLSKARYRTDEDALQQAQEQVSELLARFPVYPEIDLEFLQQSFG